MSREVIAVFDLVRMDMKFLLFDRDYQVVFAKKYQVVKTTDDDGYDCEDLHQLTTWIKNTFEETLQNPDFNVHAINFTTYGASFVHLDDSGIPVTPLYFNLKPYPEDLLDQFYKKYGSKETIALQTASPPMGMANSGLQLYWLKHHKPYFFKRIKRSLHFPQYCSYLITGRRFSEITSIGCHTALWNYKENQYHHWVVEEGIDALFPPIAPSNSDVDLISGNKKLVAGIGIHDSSASLVPYLLNVKEPFLLLSTNTWNIAFNPFSEELLTAEDLKRGCHYYLNFLGKPVKASRIHLGYEHNYQVKKIAAHFNKNGNYHQQVKFDKSLIQKLVRENNPEKQFIPESVNVAGFLPQLPRRKVKLELFENYEEAYHQLNLDLMALQAISLNLAMGKTKVKKLFISGGFCDNSLFIKLIASRYPKLKVYTSIISRASALGAAAIIHLHWNGDRPFPGIGKIQLHKPEEELEIGDYGLI
ncbi:FGGY family carbohydrate kinase [Chitinophagaceae bacterium LB-8]|uniref:FGGY family carbohydrate kinase n=1 Tax=Paraflavisolibacter caeni TaxID=2982496 RepID=A0A9X2XPT8_9BACT|nr:FGGY family carbohydrate kinase [Paraflavisolibacter caeni]MCU7551774.1 FGGY family carbohydrate kinase [Paraflavisolibacter caeni]